MGGRTRRTDSASVAAPNSLRLVSPLSGAYTRRSTFAPLRRIVLQKIGQRDRKGKS
jgi:hypothetical protein